MSVYIALNAHGYILLNCYHDNDIHYLKATLLFMNVWHIVLVSVS